MWCTVVSPSAVPTVLLGDWWRRTDVTVRRRMLVLATSHISFTNFGTPLLQRECCTHVSSHCERNDAAGWHKGHGERKLSAAPASALTVAPMRSDSRAPLSSAALALCGLFCAFKLHPCAMTLAPPLSSAALALRGLVNLCAFRQHPSLTSCWWRQTCW
jgi:hypothetical protein